MIWYRYLYVGHEIAHKKAKIKWKINHNAGQLNIYVIALPCNCANLLEIIPSWELMQKHYPKRELFIVGLSKDYERAIELAAMIIMDVHEKTGDFRVKDYVLHRHKKSLRQQEKIE